MNKRYAVAYHGANGTEMLEFDSFEDAQEAASEGGKFGSKVYDAENFMNPSDWEWFKAYPYHCSETYYWASRDGSPVLHIDRSVNESDREYIEKEALAWFPNEPEKAKDVSEHCMEGRFHYVNDDESGFAWFDDVARLVREEAEDLYI